jgi:hypothetical protein
MITELLYIVASWPAILKAILLASLQGAACYSVCRVLEKKWPTLPWLAVILVLVFWAITVSLSPSLAAFRHSISVLAICILASSLLGAIFHRRSGGASKSFSAALVLMMLAVNLSVACCFALFRLNALPGLQIFGWKQVHYFLFGKLYSVGEWAYYFGALFYPLLMPLGVFLLHNLRVRSWAEKLR